MGSRRAARTGDQGLHIRRAYEVDTRAASAGRLLSIATSPTLAAERELIGRTCWEAFERRSQPCAGCPVFGPDAHTFGVLSEADGAYRVVRVHRHRASSEVDVCALEHSLVVDLIQEKLRRLAEQARLSARQKRALSLVSRGKSTKEIAAEAGITERTAKFHVTNLLRKLGANSRMDVLRLLLVPTSQLSAAASPRPPHGRGRSRPVP